MRALRGARVVPVVRLTHRPMKTFVGMKHRPEFEVVDWRQLGGDGGNVICRPADAAAHGGPRRSRSRQAGDGTGRRRSRSLTALERRSRHARRARRSLGAVDVRADGRRNSLVSNQLSEGRNAPRSFLIFGQRVMPDLFWDIETRSAASLRLVGRVELRRASDHRNALPLLRRRRRRGADLEHLCSEPKPSARSRSSPPRAIRPTGG